MSFKYQTIYLKHVSEFINGLPDDHQAKIRASISSLKSGDFESVYVKTLQSPVKELIVKRYRIVFFLKGEVLYFIGAFIKQSAKTPRNEIEQAIKLYKIIINNL